MVGICTCTERKMHLISERPLCLRASVAVAWPFKIIFFCWFRSHQELYCIPVLQAYGIVCFYFVNIATNIY